MNYQEVYAKLQEVKLSGISSKRTESELIKIIQQLNNLQDHALHLLNHVNDTKRFVEQSTILRNNQ